MHKIALCADWDMVLEWYDGVHSRAIEPETLPISADLKGKLREWYNHFGELYLSEDTRQPSTHALDARLFDEEGAALWLRLREELRGEYDVHYVTYAADVFESPEEWSEYQQSQRTG